MWFIPILLGLALNIVAYLIMPKPKKEKPPAVETADMENPTAESGKPIPVVFGTVTMKNLNILWYGDKNKYEYNVPA